MLPSPYHRLELEGSQQQCPNCGLIVDVEEFHKITFGCIIRAAQKQDDFQQQLLAKTVGGSKADLSLEGVTDLTSAFSSEDVNWAALPPVLLRLRRPAFELFNQEKKKIGAKDVRVCQACYDSFIDDEEMQYRLNLVPQHPPGAKDHSKGIPSIFPTFCERLSNRRDDMVFSEHQQQLRRNDRALAKKEHWRKRLAAEVGDRIEWNTIPASATVVRDMKLEASKRQSRKPTGLLSGDLTLSPDWEAATAHRTPKRSLVVPAQIENSLMSVVAEEESGFQKEQTEQDIETLAPEFPETTSFFDAGFADQLCFELHEAMCGACQYARVRDGSADSHGAEDGPFVEDIASVHPFFEIYRRGRNRFPPPAKPFLLSSEKLLERVSEFDPIDDDAKKVDVEGAPVPVHSSSALAFSEKVLGGDGNQEKLTDEETGYLRLLFAAEQAELNRSNFLEVVTESQGSGGEEHEDEYEDGGEEEEYIEEDEEEGVEYTDTMYE